MKRNPVLTVTIVLSLLLIAARSPGTSTFAVKSGADAGEPGQFRQGLNTNLVDILNTLPEGSHDASGGTQNQFSCLAEGWAADPDDRDIDLNVRVLVDDVQVAQPVASNFRQDLEDAGVCPDGTCSFSVDLWGLISHDTEHSITTQAQDAQTGEWVDLPSTPKTLNCAEPHAQTFVVNSTADAGDDNWGDGGCETSTPGECTLRAAIEEANANPGMDTIHFDIPGAGPYTISPSYGFDFIFDPVVIDGTTQPGFSGAPIIELDGSSAGPDAYGVVIFAGSSTVRGLVVNRFAFTGIDLDVNGGNLIQGNYIGTDITGTLNLGNGVNGVSISQGSSGNMIGGTTAEERNIISGNGEFGIIIVDPGSTGNVIQGNYIGTDVTGTVDLGNLSVGVVIGAGASDNVVGGAEAGSRNLISGNESAGVIIVDVGSTGNLVQGNYIGTDVTGTLALGNIFEGVFIAGGASDNLVGGNTTGAGNLISGNNGNGVTIADAGTTGNMVQGNYIGTDVTGSLNLGNTGDGVLLLAPNNTIGGTTLAARNIISGNEEQGIRMQGSEASGNVVQGNFIGTDSSGMVALGNGTDCCHSGIVLHLGASNNTIGGTDPGTGNLISGNSADGISIFDLGTTGNSALGNLIGTDATGTLDLGNTGNGIGIADGPDGNTIGGTTSGAGNTIAFNGWNGLGLAGDAGSGNLISSNSIHSNDGLGIDLGEDGVTANDLFDADSGPNDLQNYAVLATAKSNDTTTVVHGTLASTGNSTIRLEFFSNDACDPSAYGEGSNFLGSVDVTTNPAGHASFTVTLALSLPSGSFVTSTATGPSGSTSEFSRCEEVKPGP